MSNQQAKQIIGNILCYTALGFIIASQANRYWSIITTASGGFAAEVQYGLYQLCSSGFCINYDWSPDTTEEWAAFATRILLIISDGFIGVAFITSFVALCIGSNKRSTILRTTGAFNIVGGSVIIIAAIAYIGLALTSFFSLNLAALNFNRNFYVGFCYIFAWISGILFIIGGALQIASAEPERVQPAQTVVWTTQQHATVIPPATYPQSYDGGYYNPTAAANYPQQEKLRASYPSY